MSGWRRTRVHPLHMEVFRFMDDIQGVRVDRVGGGGEWVAVGSQRPQGLCGQYEDMEQWTSGPVDQWIDTDGGNHDLDEVKPGWTGQERSRQPLLSTDCVPSYELGPGRPSEINQAWPRDCTIATPAIALFPEP